MIRLYMIVGFLGAGKTTFLKNLAGRLAPARMLIIVNEFGRESVDAALLADAHAAVREINNGSIFCSCRADQFEKTLAEAAGSDAEAILVEASGLADPTHVEALLQGPGLENIAYMGSICLADAVNLKKVYGTARVVKKQLAVSATVFLNKTDLASPEEIAEAETLIRQQRPDARIIPTTFGRIPPDWTPGEQTGQGAPARSRYHIKDVSLRKALIVIRDTMSYEQLAKFVAMFVEDTYRVKGFVCLEGRTSLVDCVGAAVTIEPYDGPVGRCNRMVALAGGAMPMEESITRAAAWYPGHVESVRYS